MSYEFNYYVGTNEDFSAAVTRLIQLLDNSKPNFMAGGGIFHRSEKIGEYRWVLPNEYRPDELTGSNKVMFVSLDRPALAADESVKSISAEATAQGRSR